MVLLDVMQQLVDPRRLIVAHVNHELRKQSQQEEAFLKSYCQKASIKAGSQTLADQRTSANRD